MGASTLRTDREALAWCEDLATRLGQQYGQLCPGAFGRSVCAVGLTADGTVVVKSNVTGAVVTVSRASLPAVDALAIRLHQAR